MKRHRPEDPIQRAVRGLAIHVPNDGARRPVEALIMKRLGVTAGAPNILAWHDHRAYAPTLKAQSGQVSEAQAEMLDRLRRAGVFTCVAHGLDRALAVLEAWGLLKGWVQ
jgi:hypothetical protein